MPRQTLKKRPDGRYVCKYKGFSFYGRTQSEALAAREEYKKQEKYGRKPREKYTFAEYAAEWLPTYKSEVTAKVYDDYAARLNKIASILPKVEMRLITPSDIQRLYNAFANRGDATRKKVAMTVRAVFRAALGDGIVTKNPCENIKPAKGEVGTHRNLEDWEVQIIEDTHQENPMGLFAMVMLYAGLRRGEALALDIDKDVDFENGVIHVRHSLRAEHSSCVIVQPKTKAGIRDVPLFLPLRKALTGKHGNIFTPKDGKKMSINDVDVEWRRYLSFLSSVARKKVAIRQHDCRHTFATMLYDADVDIKTAVKWMGHANEEMIMRIYAHLTAKKEESAVKKVENVLARRASSQMVVKIDAHSTETLCFQLIADFLILLRKEKTQQRATMMLRDVHYVIEAHFVMTDQANPSDNPGKFQDIVKRRLRSGQAYMQPYLGCRECTAHFRLWDGGEIPTIDETRDLGYMLFDLDYSDPENIQPMFFRAQMVHGVIDLTDCEVVK